MSATLARKTPGVERSSPSPACRRSTTTPRCPTPASPTSFSRTGPCAARKHGLLPMLENLNKAMAPIEEAKVRVLPPPPIQGIGFAAGFTMQVELQDDSADYAKLARVVETTVAQCRLAVEHPAGLELVPRQDAAILDRRRSGEGAVAAGDRRPGVPGARRLSRLELRQPVHQVRPHLPGLRAGRLPISACASTTSTICRCATVPAP